MTSLEKTPATAALHAVQVVPRYVNYTVPIPWEETNSKFGPALNHMQRSANRPHERRRALNTAAYEVREI